MNRLYCAQLKIAGQSIIASTVKQSMRSPAIVMGYVLSISFLFFFFLGYEFVLKNNKINYSTLHKTIVHLEQTIQEQKKVLSTLRCRLKPIKKSVKNTEKLIKKSETNKVINDIFKLCELYHINIDSYDVKENKRHEFYVEQSILIELEGRIQDMMPLLNKIKKMNVPLVFDDFTLVIDDKKGTVKIIAIIKAYQAKDSGEFNSNRHDIVKKIDQKSRVNGHSIVRDHCSNISLDSVYFVGILRQDQTIWALIKKPDGSIAFVVSGDFIGQEHGKIVLITDEFIRIQVHSPIDKESIKKIMTLRLKRASE